jgi:uncharacterized lipoprotein NlpE involved in copper resistance
MFLFFCSSLGGLNSELVGIYEGTIPCADCPGIQMVLQLKEKAKYESIMNYVDRHTTYKEKGVWFIKKDKDENGRERIIIELNNSETKHKTYLLLDNNTTLELLDADKHRIATNASHKLKKI